MRSLPNGLPSEATYAYDLPEIRQMLSLIQHESTRVIIALAGYAGLSRSEFEGFAGKRMTRTTGRSQFFPASSTASAGKRKRRHAGTPCR